MNPRVRFEEEAEVEYRLAGRYYEQQREHLGVEFLDAVDATIEQILELPRAGPLLPGMPSDLLVRRRPVTRFPYHVVYLENPSYVWILAVAHDRRKPHYWKDRLEARRQP